jgi:hypothetical protein
MKKVTQFLLVIMFVGVSAGAFAQTKFAIGIKAGPNFANINTEASADQNYKNRTGFHAGAFLLLRGQKVGIQPEILFSQQGSQVKYSGQPDLKSNFSYFNIPIIVKLYTIAGINLQIGPQIGLLTSAKQENFNVTTGRVTEESVKSDFNKTDFSLALGAGWDLPFGLAIDGRYNLGLSDIRSGAGNSVKNQVWQISVGYRLFTSGQ